MRALSFCTSKKHAIPIILRLELIVLSLIALALQIETRKTVLVLSMLILIVREGVSGLTIILKTTKAKGNDLLTRSII